MQTSLTIGNFDGVHLGHQQLIRRVLELSKRDGVKASLLTFEPHPREFLGSRPVPMRLCTIEEKIRRIKSLGLEDIVVQPFTKEFSNLSAADFLVWLKDHFNPKDIVVGKNFYFGKNREGTPPRILEWGKLNKINVEVMKPVEVNRVIISSSEIRKLIQDGSILQANRLMNFAHRIECTTVKGDSRGSALGFPTINSPVPTTDGSKFCLPPHGVYITNAIVSDKAYPAVTNFGIRPTFHDGKSEEFFESHVLVSLPSLSVKKLTVEFLDRIRPEIRFNSKDELIQQIHRDIHTARTFHRI